MRYAATAGGQTFHKIAGHRGGDGITRWTPFTLCGMRINYDHPPQFQECKPITLAEANSRDLVPCKRCARSIYVDPPKGGPEETIVGYLPIGGKIWSSEV